MPQFYPLSVTRNHALLKYPFVLVILLFTGYLSAQAQKPTISSFSPGMAPVGSTITIEGYYFTGATTVAFGGTTWGIPADSFTVVSDTEIRAIVPRNARPGLIVVTTPGGTGSSTTGFSIVNVPYIDYFTPASGPMGTLVTVKGFNFSSANSVSFGGTPAASFQVISDSTIQAIVGAGSTGDVKIINAIGSRWKGTYTYVAEQPSPGPDIDSFTPASGSTGTIVTIKGNHFTGAIAVSFGGTPAANIIVSDSIITAEIGSGASGTIKVTTPYGSDSLGTFTYIIQPVPVAPDVISFSPVSAAVGSAITIRGHHFTGSTDVRIGGAVASFTVVSDSTISAVVAAGAGSGWVGVTTTAGVDSLNGFTIITPAMPPQIISFTPITGTAGTVVTIKGYQFTGATAVSFGGTPAANVMISDSTIIAEVGNGSTGAVRVTTPQGTDSLGTFTYSPGILAAPNPAQGFVVMDYPATNNNSLIKLTNSMGNVVKEIKVGPGTSQTRIDLSGVAPGIYVLWWGDGTISFNRRIMIR
jgi:hypothetical protein